METLKSLATRWMLTEYGQGDHQQRTIDLPNRALIVGRSEEADVIIPSTSVSKRHARLTVVENEMIVEDLGSTNGTHLNGTPITCSTLAEGDLLQFANSLYRVGRRRQQDVNGTMEEGILPWAQTLLTFDRLLSERAVVPHFQPIVTMDRQQISAYELLARSDLDGLQNPALMFGAAERLGQQAALSELMRDEGMRIAASSAQGECEFFLNTHPVEIVNDRLIGSLRDLRANHPTLRIAIEIHEAAITNAKVMADFRRMLDDFEMRLSYDDFGAGQGRLLELGEVPPDVLKFDMQLIRGIDSATAKRHDLLATLVKIAIDVGTTPLAEGIETHAEHLTCQQMGFELGQGFYFGRPQRLG